MAKLKMPANCIDVTEQYRGTVIALIGCSENERQFVHELRKSILAKQELNADCPTLPGFKEQKRNGVRAIIGYPKASRD